MKKPVPIITNITSPDAPPQTVGTHVGRIIAYTTITLTASTALLALAVLVKVVWSWGLALLLH